VTTDAEARACAYCGAPAGERDRFCYACLRPLPAPAQVSGQSTSGDGAAALPAERAPTAAARTLREPARQGATPGAHPGGDLQVEVRWGRYRELVEVPERGAIIGSTNVADVVVPASFLSPGHARLAREESDWVIEALVPEASVLVHGEDVRRAVLTDGAILRLGDRIGNVVNLRVLSGAGTVRARGPRGLRAALPANGQEISIGSDPRCDVHLEHALVRARHATLRRDDGGAMWLEDRATVAGTYVNGERLRGRREVRTGDTVQIGP
jgi:pSer/pThr/pTyr-binding forkhead associated (FHA) protein